MPAYPGVAGSFVPAASNASPIALQKGESCYVLGALASTATQLPVDDHNVTFEAAPAGATETSIAVDIQGTIEDAPAPSVSVEIHLNGAPGAGESFAIQEADTDADGFYITMSNSAYTINSFNSNNAARVDLSPTGGRFMRVVRTKGANAVGCTCKITRLG